MTYEATQLQVLSNHNEGMAELLASYLEENMKLKRLVLIHRALIYNITDKDVQTLIKERGGILGLVIDLKI